MIRGPIDTINKRGYERRIVYFELMQLKDSMKFTGIHSSMHNLLFMSKTYLCPLIEKSISLIVGAS